MWFLTLSNGGTAVIHASWSSHLGMNARGVIGTLGTAVVEGSGLWTGKHIRWQTCEMEQECIEVIDDSYATSNCYEMEKPAFLLIVLPTICPRRLRVSTAWRPLRSRTPYSILTTKKR